MARQYDAQKFIGESRAPRVQIEYDVEVYGSQKKVELPFVVGVMADLSGDNGDARAPIDDRKFSGFDTDNFDERMEQIRPTLSLQVENTLTSDGTVLSADLDFRSMEDFEPARLVKRIPELASLLDARERLKELIMYMDGKSSAEEVVAELLRGTEPEVEVGGVATDDGSGNDSADGRDHDHDHDDKEDKQ
ncbi:type VI secretion system contractile sheath small subunit [Variovorax sp.]|uniref:type VI secretion system contractile sheath small subunit n=1 Tax=Variovorax sp. TaxID=1871043 RepID=UPI002D4B498F|nr:type VI secretion system contractile sheath small subunit [Variovorax sp.]HYP83826.1 type VI secretion system contractile sheath small subunit [Variovorax sp.]